MKREIIVHKNPKSPISENFKALRTNMQFINTNKEMQTILFTSTVPGEGKSLVASNTAVTFAQTGKKVVLIDADMRKGRVFDLFKTPQSPGLSNYLLGVDEKNDPVPEPDIYDSIYKTEVENLYVMPSGIMPLNPSELLLSEEMIKTIEELKSIFDIIVIDGTPSAVVTDSVILSRIVDSTIIVAAHKHTRKDNLVRIVKNIENVGGNITGVVYNKVPEKNQNTEAYYYANNQPVISKNTKKVFGKEGSAEKVPKVMKTIIKHNQMKQELKQELGELRAQREASGLNSGKRMRE